MEAKIEAAVARTEEDIMSCPLLQKALAKVEEEAVKVIDIVNLDAQSSIWTNRNTCSVGTIKPYYWLKSVNLCGRKLFFI